MTTCPTTSTLLTSHVVAPKYTGHVRLPPAVNELASIFQPKPGGALPAGMSWKHILLLSGQIAKALLHTAGVGISGPGRGGVTGERDGEEEGDGNGKTDGVEAGEDVGEATGVITGVGVVDGQTLAKAAMYWCPAGLPRGNGL